MGEVDEKPSIDAASPRFHSSNKVADINTELSKMKASSLESDVVSLKAALSEKDALLKNLQTEVERSKETEKKLLSSLEDQSRELEESKAEIASLKERIDGSFHSQDSSEDDSSVQDSDIESLKIEMAQAHDAAEASSLKVSDLLEEIKAVKNELKEATEAEMTSKKAMDDLALALKEVATDASQAKEKLAAVETELTAARIDSKEWKEKHEEVKKEAELLKNTSERLRIEAEESLTAWNGKESVFVSIIKRGEDEKSSLLDENNRLLNLGKKAKDENQKVRDILKQAISEANVAKEAAGIARAENSNLKDALLDKEEELGDAMREIERVKVSESVANENVKKLKKVLSEFEVAMEEERHRSLSRQDSLQKEVEVRVEDQKEEEKKEKKREKKEKKREHNRQDHIDKKMIGKTCSFSLMKLAHAHNHHHHHKHKESVEEETAKGQGDTSHHTDDSGEGNSPSSDSYLFKGSIFDVAETPHAGGAQTHHKRRSSCTFLEEVETINPEDLESLEEGELNDKGAVAAARKKKAFIRRFGDLLVRRKSLSFSHKKESSTDSQDKQQQPQTPTSPSLPQPPLSPEP
ncbi:BnaAnng26740D [Brassica napus]|uniref:BnaAnng26740D protein n=1 Tax=Brassica napus TaxID=3708 RepID=A0A078JLD4_BRANA|nr:BnaAnng26740D [Brassica napus]